MNVNADKKIAEIVSTININNEKSQSKYYGRLVKWDYNRSLNEWCYGIGLTDKKVFDTGRSLKIIEPTTPKFIIDIYRQKFTQDLIIERLKYALMYIEHDASEIRYDQNEWNDEHFARLIVTNSARSYKVEKKYKNNNKNGKKINKYIESNNPHNIIDTFFPFPKLWHRGKFWSWIFLAIIFIILILLSLPFYLILIVLISILIVFSFISDHEWSGFQNKQLWNWLELLIIPVFLAFGGLAIQNQAKEQQQYSDKQQAQQESLKKYFQDIQKLVYAQKSDNTIKEHSIEKTRFIEKLSYEEKKLLESFTQLVFSEIDANQKRQVVKFLYELELISCYQEQDNIENCNNTISLEKVDLTGANLTDLSLINVSFQGANLREADFTNTNLELANFKDSILNDAKFDLAKLKNINTANVTFGDNKSANVAENKWRNINRITSLYSIDSQSNTSFVENNCSSAIKTNTNSNQVKSQPKDKTRKNYENQDFSQANLEQLNLSGANFMGADLRGANFKNTILENANFKNSKLKGINLQGAYLKNIEIDSSSKRKLDKKSKLIIDLFQNKKKPTNLTDKNLSDSNLTAIMLEDIILKNSNLNNSKLINARLKNIDLNDSELSEVDFSGSNIDNVKFKKSNLSDAILNKTCLIKVYLTDADLFVADLTEAEIIDSNLSNAILNSANLTGTKIKNTELSGAELSGAELSGADLSKALNLDKAKLDQATYDKNTKFPTSFNPKNAGMRRNE